MKNEKVHEKFGVTAEQLDEWASEYESEDWEGMEFGKVSPGRPKVFEEELATVSFKIPSSRLAAVEKAAASEGISRSEFYRRAVEHELLAIT